jgi:hypothetical protein
MNWQTKEQTLCRIMLLKPWGLISTIRKKKKIWNAWKVWGKTIGGVETRWWTRADKNSNRENMTPCRLVNRYQRVWWASWTFFYFEDADSKLFQNVRNYLPVVMVSNRRRSESSKPPMWESRISHGADISGEALSRWSTVTRDFKLLGTEW